MIISTKYSIVQQITRFKYPCIRLFVFRVVWIARDGYIIFIPARMVQ